MHEKYPDRTSDWKKQQEALKNSKIVRSLSLNDTDNADKREKK